MQAALGAAAGAADQKAKLELYKSALQQHLGSLEACKAFVDHSELQDLVLAAG